MELKTSSSFQSPSANVAASPVSYFPYAITWIRGHTRGQINYLVFPGARNRLST